MVQKFDKDFEYNPYKMAIDDIKVKIENYKKIKDESNVKFFEIELAKFEEYYKESIADSVETTEE